VKESTPRKVERKYNNVYCTSCGVAKPAREIHALNRWLLPGNIPVDFPICEKCWKRKQKERRKKRKTYNIEWRKKNPHKMEAHSAIAKALRKGELNKPKECQMCGRGVYLYAHHWDYNKPLLVTWVCVSCHNTLGIIKEEDLKKFLPIIEKFKNGKRLLREYKQFWEIYEQVF
jgi:ribosomal protein S27AE